MFNRINRLDVSNIYTPNYFVIKHKVALLQKGHSSRPTACLPYIPKTSSEGVIVLLPDARQRWDICHLLSIHPAEEALGDGQGPRTGKRGSLLLFFL